MEDWTRERQGAKISTGFSVASDEALQLAKQSTELLGLVQEAVKAAGPGAVDSLPQHIWLPAPDAIDAKAIQQLLAIQRTSALPEHHIAGEAVAEHDDADLSSIRAPKQIDEGIVSQGDGNIFYQFTGTGAWHPSGEHYQCLEERVQRLREFLGQEALPDGTPLIDAAQSLDRRLSVLHQACDERSREELWASVQVLASDIDVAMEEVRRFEELEAADKEAQKAGGEEFEEDLPAERINALHAEAKGLNSVADRVGDLERQLVQQQSDHAKVLQFSQDLSGAEARFKHTKELLDETLAVAEAMTATVKDSNAQLKKSSAALEKKIDARNQAMAAFSMKPSQIALA
jgi:hypothetical protein